MRTLPAPPAWLSVQTLLPGPAPRRLPARPLLARVEKEAVLLAPSTPVAEAGSGPEAEAA